MNEEYRMADDLKIPELFAGRIPLPGGGHMDVSGDTPFEPTEDDKIMQEIQEILTKKREKPADGP